MKWEVGLLSPERYGYDFIPPEHLPPGKDEYWIRNAQAAGGKAGAGSWRPLRAAEIEALEKNGNRAAAWDHFLVTDPFDPALIRNSSFYGLVRLGALEHKILNHHDFCIPAGIQNSRIVSCDIGTNVAIQDCSLISHYIIFSRCILSRIDELVTTNHAKFGNGIIKDGETGDLRVWIDVMNEAGGRSILPFAGMISADAFLWAAYRDDGELLERLVDITQKTCGTIGGAFPDPEEYGPGRRGYYGVVGSGTVIKSCRIIKDTAVGEGAYIKGANKLKNLTVLSSQEESTQIGEGVELVNGIIGYGSHVFYGAKAVRFVLGNQCNLKYGARLIHSVLGDNSTVSCCEILNNLVFPVHEQHHNNSFLIASLLEGMSNMAAGATVGSNHNSRSNDGEIRAGRGFWPGLSVTLKHSSRFASFCLIVKGDYPYELNIPLPFSLVTNNVRMDRLELMPAYFWMYNLYALERNSWKTRTRDRRKNRVQRIEAEYLAPDTAEEILGALDLMRGWMDAAGAGAEREETAFQTCPAPGDPEEDPEYDYSSPDEDVLLSRGLERHKRPQVILKPRRALSAYREMLFYYGMKSLVEYLSGGAAGGAADGAAAGAADGDPEGIRFCADLAAALEAGDGEWKAAARDGRVKDWVNLGGQIVPAYRVDRLRKDIREGRLNSWEDIHRRYAAMAAAYGEDRARHAWSVLALVCGKTGKTHPLAEEGALNAALEKTVKIAGWVRDQVFASRAKDFHDPFRKITYRNQREMEQVIGRAEDNFFVRVAEEKYRDLTSRVEQIRRRFFPAASPAPQNRNNRPG
ncbi:MAG: DUF4954 family protein [Spirochaetaceae bacterium]|jgi:hypothetical protein|nr:DUF4954 family protein [Spirochaetaceae bacterium]